MTRGSRIVRNVIAALLMLAGIALLAGWWFVHRPLPRLDGQITMAGLKEGVIVDRDQWGRPWIRAKSTEDLVMAQGYVMAQDRLWQMDLLRRAAAGDLSEIVGPAALKIDEENRILGMRQAAERAAKESSPEIRGLLESYARGVNQYIAQAARPAADRIFAFGLRTKTVDAGGHLSDRSVHVEDADFHVEVETEPAIGDGEGGSGAGGANVCGGLAARSLHCGSS